MMPMSATLLTSRDPKASRFIAICEAAYDKAELDEDRAQRLNENGEFAAGLRELIKRCSLSNQFANEEVRSSYVYPPNYQGPKPIGDQVRCLAKALALSPDATLTYIEEVVSTWALPAGAEGLFAIPRWEKVAATYCAALQKILDLLAGQRRFFNYRQGEIGPERLRQYAPTAAALEAIGQQQPGDFLVLPAQFGMRHRGRSSRRAREVLSANEFGLGAFALGSMAYVHPERFVTSEELDVDAIGDEFAPDAGGHFSKAPYFCFGGDELEFGAGYVDGAHVSFGGASGFFPPDPCTLNS
jgi:hypothetical protein